MADTLGIIPNKLKTMSLIVSTDVPSSDIGHPTVIDTYGGRKFSDFDILVFALHASSSEMSLMRDTETLPSTVWKSGVRVSLKARHGSNMEKYSVIDVMFYTDTSIAAYKNGDALLSGIEIWGISLAHE